MRVMSCRSDCVCYTASANSTVTVSFSAVLGVDTAYRESDAVLTTRRNEPEWKSSAVMLTWIYAHGYSVQRCAEGAHSPCDDPSTLVSAPKAPL